MTMNTSSAIVRRKRKQYGNPISLVSIYLVVWLFLISLLSIRTVSADDAADDGNGGGDDYYNNVGAGDDLTAWDGTDDQYTSASDIKYWTDYALLPKRCIQ